MIAYVKGFLEHISENSIVVDCHGIGYLIHVSASTLSRLPARGNEVKLFTYMQVREDGQFLHGFLTREEVRMFTLLISVTGIGPKVASGILSVLTPSQIMIAIVADDAAALTKAPGVGKKTAQRLTLELRDKIKSTDTWAEDSRFQFQSMGTANEKQDAMDALLALGYSRSESLQAVLETAEEGMATEQIIRQALKRLAR